MKSEKQMHSVCISEALYQMEQDFSQLEIVPVPNFALVTETLIH